MIVTLAAAVSMFFMGINSFRINASSANTRHANSNYYFLTNPKMMTADNTHVYAINDRQLLVLNTSGDLVTPVPSYSINFDPIYIKHSGNIVFLFEADGFTPFLNNTIQSKIIYGATHNFFDAIYVPTLPGVNEAFYRVFYANTTEYGWYDYKVNTNGTLDSDILSSSLSVPRRFTTSVTQQITAIACEDRNTLFICTSEKIWADEPEEYNIFQVTLTTHALARAHSRYLDGFTSFAVVANKNMFVYINNNGNLTLFDRSTDTPYIVQLDDDRSTFKTYTSRKPTFVTTVGSQVYAIDEEKRSIDLYTINGSALVHDRIIAAHRGGDSGFFNRPTSMTLISSSVRSTPITSSEYLVTDRAGQIIYNKLDADGRITSSPFFADSSLRLSDNVRATYDNFDTVYIYDYDSASQVNRVRAFALNGTPRWQEYKGFGQVTHMFSDQIRTIYALDVLQEKIHIFGESTQRTTLALPARYATQNTKGIYSEQLNSIILCNGSGEVYIMPLEGSTTRILAFDENVLDIDVDTLGNLLILSTDGDLYNISLHARNGSTFETAAKWAHEIKGATVDSINPSLNYDRMNGRILYIGAHHAIESFELKDLDNADIWLYTNHNHDMEWKTSKTPLSVFNPVEPTSTPIFLNAPNGVIIYQYPSGTRATGFAPKGSVLKVLNYSELYVLYENPLTGEYITGYVSMRAVAKYQPYKVPSFTNARVMFSHTIVYKYPTTDRSNFLSNQNLTILTIDKNFEQANSQTGGLRLTHLVDCTDVRGFSFYEIRLNKNANGSFTPHSEGTYVGYVNKNNVIDYYLGPSIKKYLPNAIVRIPKSHGLTGVQVYDRVSGTLSELPNEFLKNKQDIFVIGKLNTSSEYTNIYYYDDAVGRAREGWIKTDYIVMNGLSAWQLIAIAMLSILVIGGIAGSVWYWKIKRN